ncbi:DNA methyltransferase [Paenibacillus larvae]|nr:DNA methyltransferase [Paenibacillus larvae]MDT2243114.1 DNA methyltransferase [Paenibacillus larvae]
MHRTSDRKPTELMKIIVENSTEEGETVVDFFSGSGPVTEACLKLKSEGKLLKLIKNIIK